MKSNFVSGLFLPYQHGCHSQNRLNTTSGFYAFWSDYIGVFWRLTILLPKEALGVFAPSSRTIGGSTHISSSLGTLSRSRALLEFHLHGSLT